MVETRVPFLGLRFGEPFYLSEFCLNPIFRNFRLPVTGQADRLAAIEVAIGIPPAAASLSPAPVLATPALAESSARDGFMRWALASGK